MNERRLLLVAMAIAIPAAAETAAGFKELSIKPAATTNDRRMNTTTTEIRGTSITVLRAVSFAWSTPETRIQGGPSWIREDGFDIVAVPESSDVAEARAALQKALAERFSLKVRKEQRNVDAMVLRQIAGKPHKIAAGAGGKPTVKSDDGYIEGKRARIAMLAGSLERRTGKPVIDETGLTDFYDFSLNWSGDAADLPKSVRNQLGLELVPEKRMVEVLVIDGAAK